MALVVDASALTYAVLGSAPGPAALRDRLAAEECHAPHLIDAEFGNALRRLVRMNELAADEAFGHLTAGPELIDHRHTARGALVDAAWALRANLSFYDALYAALAALLSAPLLTADSRLARSPGLGCAVEQVGG
jgi:predicted nucleic acid-binding protein